MSESPTAAPDGGPPTARGGRTRQRILGAAAKLIHERGASATTIQQVREAADVSASQLYHYFADKQALVRAVVEYQGARILAGQEAAAIGSLDGLKRWRDELIAQGDLSIAGCPLGGLGSELADTDPSGRDVASVEFNHWRDAIAEGLRRIRERGELRPDFDTEALAVALLASLQGGLLLARIAQSSEPLERALDATIALIEMQAPPSRPSDGT
jgi:AcrR family transcriptional regulator